MVARNKTVSAAFPAIIYGDLADLTRQNRSAEKDQRQFEYPGGDPIKIRMRAIV